MLDVDFRANFYRETYYIICIENIIFKLKQSFPQQRNSYGKVPFGHVTYPSTKNEWAPNKVMKGLVQINYPFHQGGSVWGLWFSQISAVLLGSTHGWNNIIKNWEDMTGSSHASTKNVQNQFWWGPNLKICPKRSTMSRTSWQCFTLGCTTTWDVKKNPANNRMNYLSSGAGFLPSTASSQLFFVGLVHQHVITQTMNTQRDMPSWFRELNDSAIRKIKHNNNLYLLPPPVAVTTGIMKEF